MDVKYYELAEKDLDSMDDATYILFDKHIDKISHLPPRRHLKFGMPFNVEEIGQGRIVYNVKNEILYIIRCFRTHKEYEKWYKSFK
jgi:hypothetical protein